MTSQPLLCGLEGLAARCEAATGANIALETSIAIAIRYGAVHYPNCPLGSFRDGVVQADMGGENGWSVGWRVPPWTASLDAALALCGEKLPEASYALFGPDPSHGENGYCTARVWDNGDMPNGRRWVCRHATTPALALCAALLRALSSHEAGER